MLNGAAAVPLPLWEFLKKLNSGENPKDEAFLLKVAAALMANDIDSPADLIGAQIEDMEAGTVPGAGGANFIRKAIHAQNASMASTLAQGSDGHQPPGNNTANSVSELVRCVKEQQAKIHVDLEPKIEAITLKGLPTACHPLSSATDKLAALVEKNKQRGIANPFPFMETMEFAPPWAKQAKKDTVAEEDVQLVQQACAIAKALGKGTAREEKRRPDNIAFLAAMENFSLAAHAVGIWTYTAARAHIRVLMEIAANASNETDCNGNRRRHVLMMHYDEVARMEWSEKAARGDQGFCVNKASTQVDYELLNRARMAHDAALHVPQHSHHAQHSHHNKGGGKGQPQKGGGGGNWWNNKGNGKRRHQGGGDKGGGKHRKK